MESRNDACYLELRGAVGHGAGSWTTTAGPNRLGGDSLEERMAEIKLRPDTGQGTNWVVWVLMVLAIMAALWFFLMR